jgi:glutamate-1-semialdehyde aminotransferase
VFFFTVFVLLPWQVRYSLSGSEAMDAALKDIKSSCRGKDIIVRFSSAYHGHVSGVDVLNCGPTHLFLKECDAASLEFIEEYHYRIAAVVVNPMQHFTGINKPSPPGDG